ncbi:MAG: hypothetical protein RI883_73 [Bacteroidota bacterium]|jgi:hypothetical protein
MLKKVCLLSVALLLFLVSCTAVEESNYELPKTVQLSTYSLLNPMFVEEFLEAPLKIGNIWNDSLISLCRINKIQFVYKGEKNPDNIAETHINTFNQHGQIKEYSYSNFELSKTEFTKINFEYSEDIMTSINSSLFFGQKKNQNISIIRNDECIILIKTKKSAAPDSTFIYSKNVQPTVIVEKLGDFISKINFVLDVKKPVVSVRSWIKRLNISEEQFLSADRYLTFTDNGMPQKSYHLTENLVKEYLSNEWIYENNKKLIGYKKYINNQIVKEFSFNYSEDKLMRSFTFNKKVYEVKYN